MDKEKRNIKLTIRLSESEYDQLTQKATGQMAVWLRELALNQQNTKQFKYRTADPDLLRHIARIGNNLNQIARAINTNKIESLVIIAQLDLISQDIQALRRFYTEPSA